MLPPFIIDQIRRREEQERRHEAPSVELPLPSPTWDGGRREQRPRDDEPQRGIVVIDLG
jgi:hypothetical protein